MIKKWLRIFKYKNDKNEHNYYNYYEYFIFSHNNEYEIIDEKE